LNNLQNRTHALVVVIGLALKSWLLQLPAGLLHPSEM